MHIAVDIDDTLCYTTLWWMEVFQERFGNPEHLSPEAMLEKYEIVQRVPYWQTPEARALIDELISNDANRMSLKPIPGGRTALQQLEQKHTLVYLTSRQEPHRQKTLDRLAAHHFPDYELIMRPLETSEAVDAHGQFTRKARYLLTQYPAIDIIIDNSVSLAQQLHRLHYPGKHVLFGHVPEKESPTPYRLQTREDIRRLEIL